MSSAPRWELVAPLLSQVSDNMAELTAASPAGGAQLDQSVTSWRDGLATMGLDADDPEDLYAVIVGVTFVLQLARQAACLMHPSAAGVWQAVTLGLLGQLSQLGPEEARRPQ